MNTRTMTPPRPTPTRTTVIDVNVAAPEAPSRTESALDAFRSMRQRMEHTSHEDRVLDAIIDGTGPGSLRSDIANADVVCDEPSAH